MRRFLHDSAATLSKLGNAVVDSTDRLHDDEDAFLGQLSDAIVDLQRVEKQIEDAGLPKT